MGDLGRTFQASKQHMLACWILLWEGNLSEPTEAGGRRAGSVVPGGGVSTPENTERRVESLPLLIEVWATGCRQPGGKEPISVIELSRGGVPVLRKVRWRLLPDSGGVCVSLRDIRGSYNHLAGRMELPVAGKSWGRYEATFGLDLDPGNLRYLCGPVPKIGCCMGA